MEIQVIFTALAATLGTTLLTTSIIPAASAAVFQTLALAYMFYGMLHCIVILLLYFDDRRGALVLNSLFLFLSTSLPAALLALGRVYYGVGFFAASLISCIIAVLRLVHFIKRLNYYIFCSQPMYRQPLKGIRKKFKDFTIKHFADEEDML